MSLEMIEFWFTCWTSTPSVKWLHIIILMPCNWDFSLFWNIKLNQVMLNCPMVYIYYYYYSMHDNRKMLCCRQFPDKLCFCVLFDFDYIYMVCINIFMYQDNKTKLLDQTLESIPSMNVDRLHTHTHVHMRGFWWITHSCMIPKRLL